MKYMLSLLFGFFILSNADSVSAQQISVQQFDSLSKTPKVLVLDVRTAQEYNSGHLNEAVNIDIYSPDFKTQALKLDKSKKILVYCRSGARSAQAAQFLRENGYQVEDLKGGIMQWQAQGKPTQHLQK